VPKKGGTPKKKQVHGTEATFCKLEKIIAIGAESVVIDADQCENRSTDKTYEIQKKNVFYST